MQRASVFIIGMVALLAAATSAWAQGHIKLTSVAEMEKAVFNQEGQKVIQRIPAARVVPGSEVIFTSHYENTSGETADKAVITDPIPEHMLYKDGSAQGNGSRITFSVDNGKSYNIPGKLFVFDAAGRPYPASPKDYTHIRWTIENPLAPGAKGSVSFRAILK